ncbi:MBOAT family O-acyltransferase [Butyrivibrio sp. AE3004]|uniref:MBOAT family O-acyltransferase n=1 Tax=Butyrivibrio sp. AE3004 TaxID=1506994 RepID=UPI0018CC1450|nr:MBOAT family O-acyltransferase [Butyrivibrio sp. AE3004]
MKLWLIAMSAFFFVGYGKLSCFVFLGSIAFNLAFAMLAGMGRTKPDRLLKVIAIICNVILLCFFKYMSDGAMPVAISFYTFSQIMFIAELGNDEKQCGILDYLCYILFFPKVLQGPIADYKNINTGIEKLHEDVLDFENIAEGMRLFTLGLAKKVLLADVLGKAADFGYGILTTATAMDALIIAVSYSFQLYFDFSGYCDMAEGICRMLGMDLQINFDAPYRAENIAQFWDRWHISLTKFFTKYIYIPLGGSRRGKLRTYINIMVVFLISGIWHGNGWGFIVWGMMHGVLMVITRFYGKYKRNKETGTVGRTVGTILTFLYVNCAWVFFRAPKLSDAKVLLGKLIDPNAWSGLHITVKLAECFMVDEIWYIFKVTPISGWNKSNYICMWIIMIISAFVIFRGKTARKIAEEKKHPFLYGVLFVWGVVSLGGVSTFLYVNF